MYSALPDPETSPQLYDSVSMKRGIAWVIDIIIVTVIALVLIPLTAFIGAFFFPLLFLVAGFFYRLMTIASGSATWGMRIMSIELRRLDGDRLDASEAFLHTLGYYVSFAVAPLQLISVIMMLLTRQGQGLTDSILGTTAVNRMMTQ